MSENCNHNCEGCQANCGSRKADFKQPANKYSHIKKVIGVVSGKGGVGKSLVTCLLAAGCAKAGLKVGVLDADITGPSVPKSFGVHSRAMQDGECLLPAVTDGGIKLMSINLLLESESAPVVWRGPVISGVINQFWSDVRWGELDYLFVDMPPGTGDVALTVFQGLPVDGIVIVTTPPGSGADDRGKGFQYGQDDESAGAGLGGEYERLCMPGLRQVPPAVWCF